jgi:hypothetical protein
MKGNPLWADMELGRRMESPLEWMGLQGWDGSWPGRFSSLKQRQSLGPSAVGCGLHHCRWGVIHQRVNTSYHPQVRISLVKVQYLSSI